LAIPIRSGVRGLIVLVLALAQTIMDKTAKAAVVDELQSKLDAERAGQHCTQYSSGSGEPVVELCIRTVARY
jgi:hypothetical protein